MVVSKDTTMFVLPSERVRGSYKVEKRTDNEDPEDTIKG